MKIIERLLNTIASIRFCSHFFPLKTALKRPIQIHYKLQYNIKKGAKIVIDSPLKPNLIKIGMDNTQYIQAKNSIVHLESNSELHFSANAIFSRGICLWLEKGAKMNIGNNFYCNNNCTFRCTDKIILHDNVLLGWNIMLNTTDGHILEINGIPSLSSGTIEIGNHTWIASNTNINKNVIIAEECIVAQNSLVNKKFLTPHCMIAGIPAKVVRKNIKRLD